MPPLVAQFWIVMMTLPGKLLAVVDLYLPGARDKAGDPTDLIHLEGLLK